MKKMFSRMMSLVLTLMMCIGMLNITAFAVEQSSAIQIVEQGGKVYYLAEPQEGEVAGEDNFDVWTSKTIAGTKNEDEFEVTLQVGTTIKPVPNDVAVVLVMDASGSMMKDKNGYTWGRNGELPTDGRMLRIDYARNAALEFAEQLAESSGGAQRMLSVVEFGNNAMTVLPWTNANDNGTLNEEVTQAISSVDVNFAYERSFWDEELMETFTLSPDKGVTNKQQKVENWSDELYTHETKSFFEDAHCTFEKCVEPGEHTHCTYSICANPVGHTHCERRYRCDVAHDHCWDIQAVCGRTDEHQHIIGCTADFCQDTTPNHKHACVHGGVRGKYAFPDWSTNYSDSSTVRCLNPDPSHTHYDYDGDSYRFRFDRIHQKCVDCCTNMEGGLMLARNLVNAGKAAGGAIEGIDDVYVILLSDGFPTFHVNQDLVGNTDTELEFLPGEMGGINISKWEDVADIVNDSQSEGEDVALVDEIKDIAEFYTILYGAEMNDKLGGNHLLSGVTSREWFTGTGENYINPDALFDSPELDELNTVFINIKERIDVLAKAWTVTDELSDDVTFGEFKLNGDYAGVNGTSVDWSLGRMVPESGDGSMANPYIYTLKYTVKLKSAKDNVKETSLAYDANSDSAVSLPGVWTGTNTQLQYLMLEKEQLDTITPDQIQEKLREAAFEDVSVKGLYADYEFIKKNKETDEIIEGAGFTLYDADGKVYGSEVFSDSEGKVTFTDIPKGEYTMKETTVPSGMQQMSDLESVISWGMITAKNGGEMDDVIYNISIPTPGKMNIFVEKLWNDSNDADGKRPESITVQLMANGNAVSDKTLTLNAGNNWSGSFDNLNEYEGDIEIVYTIAEVEVPEGYESVITGDAETGFTVTNTYVTIEEDPTEPEETEPEETEPEETEPEETEPEETEPEETVPEETEPEETVPEETEPEDVIEIPEEDVPLADVPKTGDMILQYSGLAITSGVAAILVGKTGKKNCKKEEDEE